ncbi:MAG TPA: hypothetical protein VGS79_18915 [Puia sp.]|nr:hypothetical protein [Puia sp.]
MPQQNTSKASQERINNMCVKTYLEIIGYGAIVSHRGYAIFPSPFHEEGTLYVDYRTNKARLNTGRQIGGVLDLASTLFKVPKSTILCNIMQYRIDLLMNRCGDRQGAIW